MKRITLSLTSKQAKDLIAILREYADNQHCFLERGIEDLAARKRAAIMADRAERLANTVEYELA